MQSPEALTDLFHRHGRKVTPQRQVIFAALHGDTAHPTADALYDRVRAQLPTISLKTVYQTLHDLADLGELQLIELGTGAIRFDPNVGRHHHLVCTACGKVRDLHANFDDLAVPPGQDEGFAVGMAEVVFRGVCASCQSPENPPTTGEMQTHG